MALLSIEYLKVIGIILWVIQGSTSKGFTQYDYLMNIRIQCIEVLCTLQCGFNKCSRSSINAGNKKFKSRLERVDVL